MAEVGNGIEDEVRQLRQSLRRLLTWVHADQDSGPDSEVVRLLHGHLGEDGLRLPVVGTDLPVFEHVNVQVALDAWQTQPGRDVQVHGLVVPPHYGGVGLQQLLHGDGLPPLRLSAPHLVDLPAGPDRTLACLRDAVLLVNDGDGAYVVLLRSGEPHERVLHVEVAGLATGRAQAVLRELAELRSQLNVYRGQLLELTRDGDVLFPALPATSREDVVLPEQVLRRVERHTLEIAARREALRAAGQHLKRGLLLHGPPGTGKTHTMRYVVQQLPATTVLMLSGRSLALIGSVVALARELQPAAIVLEDVDLVAEDRQDGPGPSPVLFELLDAMDGVGPDADLLFLLTTNRADLLELALAARPGRVDVAVEIALPDADARRRLLALHARGLDLTLRPEQVAAAVDRMAGVTASFVKELLRRAVLEALQEQPVEQVTAPAVTGEHVTRALDELLDSTQSVTRALLGVPADQTGVPSTSSPRAPAPGLAPLRGSDGHGGTWVAGMPATYRDAPT